MGIHTTMSRIVAEGIGEFLDEIIKELSEKNKKCTDNYVHNYVFSSKNYNNLFYFTIYWGLPSIKLLLKNLF